MDREKASGMIRCERCNVSLNHSATTFEAGTRSLALRISRQEKGQALCVQCFRDAAIELIQRVAAELNQPLETNLLGAVYPSCKKRVTMKWSGT